MGGSFEQVNIPYSAQKKEGETLQQIIQLETERSNSGLGQNMLYQMSPSQQNIQAMDIRSNASINSRNNMLAAHHGGEVVYNTRD